MKFGILCWNQWTTYLFFSSLLKVVECDFWICFGLKNLFQFYGLMQLIPFGPFWAIDWRKYLNICLRAKSLILENMKDDYWNLVNLIHCIFFLLWPLRINEKNTNLCLFVRIKGWPYPNLCCIESFPIFYLFFNTCQRIFLDNFLGNRETFKILSRTNSKKIDQKHTQLFFFYISIQKSDLIYMNQQWQMIQSNQLYFNLQVWLS